MALPQPSSKRGSRAGRNPLPAKTHSTPVALPKAPCPAQPHRPRPSLRANRPHTSLRPPGVATSFFRRAHCAVLQRRHHGSRDCPRRVDVAPGTFLPSPSRTPAPADQPRGRRPCLGENERPAHPQDRTHRLPCPPMVGSRLEGRCRPPPPGRLHRWGRGAERDGRFQNETLSQGHFRTNADTAKSQPTPEKRGTAHPDLRVTE